MTEKPIELTFADRPLPGWLRCPRCGKGKLFQGFLTLRPRCDVCGLDYGFADAGDGPAVFIMFLAGFIVVGAALVIEVVYQPPFWVHARAVAAADPRRHARAPAADEGAADRAAVSPQGRRGALRAARRPLSPQTAKPRRRGAACSSRRHFVFAVLIGLGIWQIQRKAWKEGADRALNERLAAPPLMLPAPSAWPSLDRGKRRIPPRDIRRRIRPRPGGPGLHRASAFRPDVSGPGYWVFTPARLAGGGIVMVNRGFVPQAHREARRARRRPVAGRVEIVGALRWPERRTCFTPS